MMKKANIFLPHPGPSHTHICAHCILFIFACSIYKYYVLNSISGVKNTPTIDSFA
jgi:hypothetical protein